MSGKRERVVVACSVFEVPKIIRSVLEYEATKVHLIHYTDKKNPDGRIYQEFYDEIVSQIKEYSAIKEKLGKSVEIAEHAEYRTSDFQNMMKTVFHIITGEKSKNDESEIYVNISSGTAEYISAATIATMMAASVYDRVHLFTVGTEPGGYQTYGEDKLRELYYENGRPVGLTKEAREPREIPMFKVPVPDKALVKGLGELKKFSKPVTAKNVIAALMEGGLMASDDSDKKNKDQNAVMRYRRRYLDKWEGEGWVAKGGSGKYVLTDEGRMITETFYVDETEHPDSSGIQK